MTRPPEAPSQTTKPKPQKLVSFDTQKNLGKLPHFVHPGHWAAAPGRLNASGEISLWFDMGVIRFYMGFLYGFIGIYMG